MKTTTSKFGAAALGAVTAVLLSSSAQAVLVAPGTTDASNLSLGAQVGNFGGTVVASLVSNFSDISTPTSAFNGILRSAVVRNAGGTLDFYYQLQNTTQPTTTVPLDSEIFRFTLDAFDPAGFLPSASYDAFIVNNGLTGVGGTAPAGSVTGTVPAFAVDRDPGITPGRGFGFDFGETPFDDITGPFTNLNPGQTSNFLVVRTPYRQWTTTSATVSGAGTGFAQALTPIPEPATALVGLALSAFIGSAEFGRRRRKANV